MRKIGTAGVALAALAVGTGAMAVTAAAQDFTLRIQTHQSRESLPGEIFAQLIEDVEAMSGGRLKIEGFWSSSVVGSVETFDAAASGILDCDMTGAAYQTGKDTAFQFLGDVMGGYDTAYQMYAWLDYGGGRELADELYHKFGMHLVGFWMQGPESLSSTTPIRTMADLQGWKFRSPPGLETDIFAALGASPVVMDFGEVYTALETGIVDGADYTALATNYANGMYDHTSYATFPGFHSMPADHLACNLEVWNSLPADLQAIMYVAMRKAALDIAMEAEVRNAQAAVELTAQGVEIIDWSAEDRATFRKFAREMWSVYAEQSEMAQRVVDSHIAFMTQLGLITEGAE
ncbi:MAG: TRAP transporter substrate-binding protein [Alphaproteobacteria bacterium]